MTREHRRASERRGRWAESLATAMLRLRGYAIVARRLRTPVGELDIVARRGRALAVVEVKARETLERAAEAVTGHQRRRLQRAAEWLVAARPELTGLEIRFDVMLARPGRLPVHLVDAWRPD